MTTPRRIPSRIPSMNFRGQKIVNADGTFTDVAQAFFDALQTMLNKVVGDEGVVIPSQDATSLAEIENNTYQTPTGNVVPTCEFGTLVYDTTNNKAMVALDDGSGNPVFKEIVTM